MSINLDRYNFSLYHFLVEFSFVSNSNKAFNLASCHALDSTSNILNCFSLLFSPCSSFFSPWSHSWSTGRSWCCNFGNSFFSNKLIQLLNMGICSFTVIVDALFNIDIIVFNLSVWNIILKLSPYFLNLFFYAASCTWRLFAGDIFIREGKFLLIASITDMLCFVGSNLMVFPIQQVKIFYKYGTLWAYAIIQRVNQYEK